MQRRSCVLLLAVEFLVVSGISFFFEYNVAVKVAWILLHCRHIGTCIKSHRNFNLNEDVE